MTDAFLNGVQAYDRYEPRDANPYDPYTTDHFSWDRGYSERKHGYVDEYGWYKDDE